MERVRRVKLSQAGTDLSFRVCASATRSTNRLWSSEFWQPETDQAVLKEPDVEPDSLSQQVCVCLAQVRDEAPPGTRLKYSQTAHHGKTCIARDTTGFPLVQQNEIGLEALGQEDSAALTRPETLACLGQREVRWGFL